MKYGLIGFCVAYVNGIKTEADAVSVTIKTYACTCVETFCGHYSTWIANIGLVGGDGISHTCLCKEFCAPSGGAEPDIGVDGNCVQKGRIFIMAQHVSRAIVFSTHSEAEQASGLNFTHAADAIVVGIFMPKDANWVGDAKFTNKVDPELSDVIVETSESMGFRSGFGGRGGVLMC